MCFFAVENESGREGTPELAQSLQSAPATLIAAYFEGFLASDPNLDIVAFFQLKRLDDCRRQTNG
jgi:hypothetical protein